MKDEPVEQQTLGSSIIRYDAQSSVIKFDHEIELSRPVTFAAEHIERLETAVLDAVLDYFHGEGNWHAVDSEVD